MNFVNLSKPLFSMGIAVLISGLAAAFSAVPSFAAVLPLILVVGFIVGLLGLPKRRVVGWSVVCVCWAALVFWVFSNGREPGQWLAFAATTLLIVVLSNERLKQLSFRQDAEQLRDFTDAVPQFLWRARPDGSIDYFNRQYFDITGEDPKDAVATQNWERHIHPDDLDEFQNTWASARESGNDVKTLFRVRHRAGGYIWMSGRGYAVRGTDGEIKHWYGGLFDVSAEVAATLEVERLAGQLNERIRLQSSELAQSQERFRTLFEDMNIAYAEQDVSKAKSMIDQAKASGATSFARLAAENPDFIDNCIAAVKVNRVNDALLHMMGYADHAELVAKPPSQNAVDSRRVMQQQLEAIFDGRHHFTTTATLLGKDDRVVTVAVGVNVSADWSLSLSTHIDITGELQAREAAAAARDDLARASRALTIGAVSTSLAHELNQPLLALNMAAKTAKRWLSKSPPQIEEAHLALDRVSSNTERMNSIIKNTRERLVKGRREPVRLDLRDLLIETGKLLETQLAGGNVNVRLSIPDDAAIVFADRIELQQVFTNLIINAVDAMFDLKRPGTIEIIARRSRNNESLVEVRDNGSGISQENLHQIFQPFFSTKSGGMGMGLQISRSIVEGFGGTMSAKNNESGGATFTVTLPADDPVGSSEARSFA